jgi:hypothetical protein
MRNSTQVDHLHGCRTHRWTAEQIASVACPRCVVPQRCLCNAASVIHSACVVPTHTERCNVPDTGCTSNCLRTQRDSEREGGGGGAEGCAYQPACTARKNRTPTSTELRSLAGSCESCWASRLVPWYSSKSIVRTSSSICSKRLTACAFSVRASSCSHNNHLQSPLRPHLTVACTCKRKFQNSVIGWANLLAMLH